MEFEKRNERESVGPRAGVGRDGGTGFHSEVGQCAQRSRSVRCPSPQRTLLSSRRGRTRRSNLHLIEDLHHLLPHNSP
ncbi:hypothetical protein TNCV_3203991 [Trichonephila clavipes]|nr:hypothetical protein TNCV_3203991 [Trichonephila clavipes]